MYTQIQKEISELANRIDEWLEDRQRKNKDKGTNYETLFYIASGLHELEDALVEG